MKIEPTELHILNDMIRFKREHPNDPFRKEALNQYTEDLRAKYKLSQEDSVDLSTGEIRFAKEIKQ